MRRRRSVDGYCCATRSQKESTGAGVDDDDAAEENEDNKRKIERQQTTIDGGGDDDGWSSNAATKSRGGQEMDMTRRGLVSALGTTTHAAAAEHRRISVTRPESTCRGTAPGAPRFHAPSMTAVYPLA